MKLLTFIVVLLSCSINVVGQTLSKEEIRQHKIKKIFTDGPNSRYYDIEEFDTLGNLLTISKVYDSMPPFVTEELKYNSSLLIEKRKYESYSPDRVEIITYFYEKKNQLLIREEDTIICKNCKIPKRITEYVYNDSNQLILKKYQTGEFNTQQKYYYNKIGLLTKILATTDNFRDRSHSNYYFYDNRKKLIKDSVYNFTSKGSLKTYYIYDENGKLKEIRNIGGKTMYYQTSFSYNDDGLLNKILSRQKGCEGKQYSTTHTYFNFERY